jgi:hypothetical protein
MREIFVERRLDHPPSDLVLIETNVHAATHLMFVCAYQFISDYNVSRAPCCQSRTIDYKASVLQHSYQALLHS